MKDHGSFQIPCIIGDISIEKALCDLGASINLMSLAMMKRMRIEEAKPTRMALQLADRTFKFIHGVVEDLLVKVEEFIFPTDFVVLDIEEEVNTSIILGRPFLAIAGAIIDVQKGELVLRLWFIRDFSKIVKPLSNLLVSNVPFIFDREYFAIGVVLGQRRDKLVYVIYYASKVLNEAQTNYTTTGKELLAIVFAFDKFRSYLIDIANFKAIRELPSNINKHLKRKLINDAKYYSWDEPYLFKRCADGILRRCISHEEGQEVLWHCHESIYGGHFSGERIAVKVLQYGFFWPTIFKDANEFVTRCNKCKRARNLPKKNEMPQRFIMELELFDVWGD
ncbi:uncharacterized protein LOC107479573 [Arachis duranensis]|uniref:Uncharacterized protein LOC107479573 n=1 Tax=Arachis duranensis TaxID=130453 RepID=A0A6P4CVH4_ARADU|nr:uncharacterized protein LOC107479573 [Arachis duranensis]